MAKCAFGVSKVEHLGHFISVEGVSTNPNKILDVQSWPIPSNIIQLREIIGLAGYYRRFIKGFAAIYRTLHDQLKKKGFSWTEEYTAAFNQLKQALISATILAMPYYAKSFIVETDASGKDIGAVLMQQGHHIAYIKQKALKHLLEQQVHTDFQVDGISKLMAFDFSIEYKKEVENKIQNTWYTDLTLQLVITKLQQQPYKSYTWCNNQLRWKGRLVVGDDMQLRTTIIEQWHATPQGGHSSMDATIKRLQSLFFWKNLSQDTRIYISKCDICQRHKYDVVASHGLLQPLPIPEGVWTYICLNFIEGLPKSNGNEAILVVVDMLSKYGRSMALSHPYNAQSVAQ
uniref:Uncharacterized protein LOC104233048 n=1 Tax=Nicotiana sylvestris TaxID=4096 RepID=A0A1U7WXK7_NICSY|nr:PREDICTED: uncharacterized protein LOC104233048 [Nicotiana sylvestris]